MVKTFKVEYCTILFLIDYKVNPLYKGRLKHDPVSDDLLP